MTNKNNPASAPEHTNTGDGVLEKMAAFLIKNANPSIVFHVKNDILKNITEKEKKELQDQVMREDIIQRIVACQKENGWLGNGFHGQNKNAGPYENQEVGVKYLGEKLIFRDTPVLIVKIRKRRPERVNPEGIAYVFNEYEKWPCRYHLDILAHTKSWRSKENISMLALSFYDSVDEHGICRVAYDERALKGMGTYSGGQLEVDWRSRTRKLCDVTYRGLLILYYSGLRM